LPGDTALTGEGRFLALHMFDARTVCDARARTHWAGGDREIDLKRDLEVRIQCDPIVFWNRARTLCRRFAGTAAFRDLDLIVSARRTTSPQMAPLIAKDAFCAADPSYRIWRPNAWIVH
jgi:hypothetical protein